MIVCVAVDNRNGLMFNHRRLSQDSELRKDILSVADGRVVWINNYTAGQFGNPLPVNIKINEDFLNMAQKGDYCFVEDDELLNHCDQIEKLFLYKWNRDYPSDKKLDLIPSELGWKLKSTVDFVGTSYKQITREEWINEKYNS